MKKALLLMAICLGSISSAFAIEYEYGKASNCLRHVDGADSWYSYDCSNNQDICVTKDGSTRTIHCECRDAESSALVTSTVICIRESYTQVGDVKHWVVVVDEP
jgi:hypothetical protein